MPRSRLILLLLSLGLLPAPASASSLLRDLPTKWTLPPIPAGAIVYPDLPYVTNGGPGQTLDLYEPKQGRNLPLIVFVHGGAFYMGDKRKWIRYELDYLAQGYAMASINYRLSGEAPFPAQVEDCKAAIRWLRAHAAKYHLDPDHFGAWGPSAGGLLVAMLGTTENTRDFDVGENLAYSSQVQAVADFFGPTDLTRLQPTAMTAGSAASQFVGCTINENPAAARRASPVAYVTKTCPPFLIVHGTKDPIVPYAQSVFLAATLKNAGVPVTLYLVPGAKHGGFHDPQVPRLTSAFFAKYLKPGKT